jgi:RNA polymerase sigma factor (sigma-70 family)
MAQVQLSMVVQKLRRLAGAAEAVASDEQLLDAFARRRDEGAFAALVSRHAALVMGVCRRTLGHVQDAEDAFQATFLVLARDAGSTRRKGTLAAWLYGVAHRIAMNAKRSMARRRAREQRAARAEEAPAEGPSWREVQELLEQEIGQLPEIYRRVFVLCCLDEQTRAEAARQLGLKEGTVSSRLAKARRLLQERLSKRGVTLSVLLAVLDLSREGCQVGAATVKATAAVAVKYAAGAGSVVPASVAALANGVTSTMLFSKTKVILALLLLVGLLAAGAGVLLVPLGAAPPGTEKPAAPTKRAKKEKVLPAEVRGRVVDPAGRPVKGARVFQVPPEGQDDWPSGPGKLLAESDAGGLFRVRLPRGSAGHWLAVAAGFGPALVEAKAPAAGKELILRLVPDVPIVGQIVNLEGKPVRGVSVRPLVLGIADKEDLRPFLAAVRAKKPLRLDQLFPRRVGLAGIPGLPARLTTDEQGRFRLTGVGRERVVALELSGPAVQQDLIAVMTRSGKPVRLPDTPESGVELSVYPPTFRHAVAPARPLQGTVRDNRTGKPIPGVVIDIGRGTLVRATTGKDGTYRLDSLPGVFFHAGRSGEFVVLAIPPRDQPYLPALKEVRRPRRLEPLRADFALPRGVWAEGRVTDKRTGKPVRATIEYVAAPGNPALKDYPDYPRPIALFLGLWHTGADGRFRVPVLTGVGALVARVPSGQYLPDESLSDEQAGQLGLPPPRTLMNFHAVARIEAKAGSGVKRDLTVDPGRSLVCKVLDPAGRPVKGARVRGLVPFHYWAQRPLPGDSFTLRALPPRRPRWVVVLHPERQLGASVEVKPGAREPLPIRLVPTGTIAGRLLAEGRPWPHQELRVFYEKRGVARLNNHFPEVIHTDEQGRFRIRGIIPGLLYQVTAGRPPKTADVARGLSLKPGEVKDLGDVKARPERE